MPERALAPLTDQDHLGSRVFVRNRVIWQLDRVEALLRLGELDQASNELVSALTTPLSGTVTPRVRRRFHAIDLQLRDLPASGAAGEAIDRLRQFSAEDA